MADKRISQLANILGSQVDDANDEIAIVDSSSNETKAITRAELMSSVANVSVDGSITVGGTVDGRDVASDGSKLDGIESGADVTDTANVTAAGALMDSELTSEASVKALDQGVATTDSPEFAGLTVDTDTLFVDASTDSVGINNVSPSASLDVTGDAEISGDLTVDTDTLYVDSSNNRVGIGTSSPATTFHASRNYSAPTGGINSQTAGIISNTSNNCYFSILSGTGSISALFFGDTDSETQGRVFYSHSSDSMAFYTSNSEAMRIDSSGNVGIGTSSPSETLDVAGTIVSTEFGSSGGSIVLGNDSHGIFRGRSGASDNNDLEMVTAGGGGSLVFMTNGFNEKARIDSGGNVGIGTSSPSATLDVNGSLSKNSGSFKIDHPVKPDTHHLVHSFVEGPQADNLYRGKVVLVDGYASVNLDEAGRMTEGTFVALNGNVQCWTTNEDGWTQVRGKVSGNTLTIEAQDPACTDEVSWLVIGERHDQHMIETEWTDENGRVITEPAKENTQ